MPTFRRAARAPFLGFSLGLLGLCIASPLAAVERDRDGGPAVARIEGLPTAEGKLRYYPLSLDTNAIVRAIGPGGELRFPDPAGGTLAYRYLRHVEHDDGHFTWVGRAQGAPVGQEAIFTIGLNAVFGRAPTPTGQVLDVETIRGKLFLRRDLGAETGNPSELQVDDARVPSAEALQEIRDNARRLAQAAPAETDPGIQAGEPTLDILLAYTPGLADYVGGDDAVRTLLQARIDLGNTALTNAGVSGNYRLVDIVRVDYPDDGANTDALDDLTFWKATSAHPLSLRMVELRHRYGADLVGLVKRFFDPESGSCGNGWVGGYLNNPIIGYYDYGYFVASHGSDGGFFCSDRTIAHEIGHNLGQNHNIEISPERDGAHSYSHGFRKTIGGGGFYTIMAYRESPQAAALTYSTPLVTRADCSNEPCGLDTSDVARSLNQTMPSVASWHSPREGTRREVIAGRGFVDVTLTGLPALTNGRWRAQSAGAGEFTVTGPTVAPAGSVTARLHWDKLPATTTPITVQVIAESSPGVTAGSRNIELAWNNRTNDWLGSARLLLDNQPVTVPVPTFNRSEIEEERLYFDVPAHATEVRFRVEAATDVDIAVNRVTGIGLGFGQEPLIGPGNARPSPVASDTGTGLVKELVVSGAQLSAGRWQVSLFRTNSGSLNFQNATVSARVSAHSAPPAFKSGQYYNPSRSGHGLFVDFAGDQWIAVWYTYRQDGTPAWYFAQAAAPGSNGIWTSPLFRVGWNGSAAHSTRVGEIAVTPRSATSMTFSYNLDGESGSETLSRLGGTGCPTGAGGPLDATGHWFSPSASGFGYSAQFEPDQEIYIAYLYDAAGYPRWLIGSKAWAEGVNTVGLEQLTGFCPLCGLRPPSSRATGTLTRQIGVNGDGQTGLTQLGVNAPLLAPLSGTWNRNLATALLSARKACQ